MLITLLALFHYFFADPEAVKNKSSNSQTRNSHLLNMSNTERTFIMIKPDGVQRGLIGDIIKRFEQKGFKLVAMKLMQVREKEAILFKRILLLDL